MTTQQTFVKSLIGKFEANPVMTTNNVQNDIKYSQITNWINKINETIKTLQEQENEQAYDILTNIKLKIRELSNTTTTMIDLILEKKYKNISDKLMKLDIDSGCEIDMFQRFYTCLFDMLVTSWSRSKTVKDFRKTLKLAYICMKLCPWENTFVNYIKCLDATMFEMTGQRQTFEFMKTGKYGIFGDAIANDD